MAARPDPPFAQGDQMAGPENPSLIAWLKVRTGATIEGV